MVATGQTGTPHDSPDEWAGQAVSNAPKMKRILLVDDEAHVLRVMKLSLDRNGYEVDTALSGEVALQMMREHDYQVVITDSELPQISGQHLCETIRTRYGDSILIFVIASATADDAMAESPDWIKSEINMEALEKPVSLRWIVARLNEFFGEYDAARTF